LATKLPVKFTPVPVRKRHDGWTPERQVAFITALAECGCVDEACKRVGMGRASAYELRARANADSFRAAWNAALDHAVQRLADAAFSRAINGVTRPVFYKGELVGERTYYDERLTMFMLRYRDPARFGRWRDRIPFETPPPPIPRDDLWELIETVEDHADSDAKGLPRAPYYPPLPNRP